MENLRRGPSLWRGLERRGVPATVLRIPANFPPVPSRATTLSGLGTPDIHGAYGIFTFFTDRIGERSRDVPGGRIERVRVRDNLVGARIPGPVNTFDASPGGPAPTDIPFDVSVAPEGPPPVSNQISVNCLKEKMAARTVSNIRVGEIVGSVTAKKACRCVAPSIRAASVSSAGTVCSAAKITRL